jgi:hypothetical protein
LDYYNRVRHYNRAAIGGLLQVAGNRPDVRKDAPLVDVEENTVVRNHMDDIVMQYSHDDTIDTPLPLPPPVREPTPLPPTPTVSTPPQWMSSSTVTIASCPATGVQDSDVIDAILECEDVCSSEEFDEEYVDVENALPGCMFEFAVSLRNSDSTRRAGS